MKRNGKAYLNVLNFRLNSALRRSSVSAYPVVAVIEPTALCNLRCPACPTGLQMDLRPKTMIDEALFKSIIDEIGDYVMMLYMYNWGEPFLHAQTPELIKYAKRTQARIALSSNLSVKMTDDYIDRLVSSGLDDLIVSLDGTTQASYQKYRRRGNIDLVRENMGRIQAAKQRLGVETPRVIWQFLVFRHNETEIEQAQEVYRAWGADTVRVFPAEMPFDPYKEGFEPSTIPEYNFYDGASQRQARARRNLKGGRPCSWLYGGFVMNPNGKVSSCCATAAEKDDFSEYRIGDKFKKVYNSPRFKQARAVFRHRKPDQDVGDAPATIEGMGANLQLTAKEVICEKCPLTFSQDAVTEFVSDLGLDLIKSFKDQYLPGEEKLRRLWFYLLMGMPHFSKGIYALRGVVRVRQRLGLRA